MEKRKREAFLISGPRKHTCTAMDIKQVVSKHKRKQVKMKSKTTQSVRERECLDFGSLFKVKGQKEKENICFIKT